MKKILFINFVVFCFSVSLFAQTPQKIEQELVKNLEEIQKYSSYGGNFDDEKLSKANDVFEKNLLKNTGKIATLKYDFPDLSKMLTIATSDDGKFRVYSWDSETGGTMHDYSRVYQFQGTDGKIYSKTEDNAENDGGPGSFVYDIFTVNAKSGTFYIVCSTFIASTSDHYQSAVLFKIKENDFSKDVKLIKTSSGLNNTLNFEYNFFSVVDRKERPVKLILYDKKTKTLSIPVVIENEEFPNGKVTDKFIKYRFNGKYFVKVR